MIIAVFLANIDNSLGISAESIAEDDSRIRIRLRGRLEIGLVAGLTRD
jgi:hypothetical protein